MPTQFFAVRGQTFHREACEAAKDGDPVELVPDPDNEFHDKEKYPGTTAIKVMANGKHIGFVPAELCKWFSEHEVSNLVLHRSRSSGTLIVYFDNDMICPKQSNVK